MSYLANLTLRLTAGMAGLPAEVRARHAAFLRTQQHDDGGFTGREGSGDLYYTSFALRALSMLDSLDESTAVRVARFLEDRVDRQLPSIDFISLVTCAMLVEMAADIDVFDRSGRDLETMAADFFEPLRRDDGGHAKTPRGGQSSTYHTFLVAGCREMVGLTQDRAEPMAALVRSRQREDGGFVEIGPMRHGGTNPTAAAVGLLRMLDALDEPTGAAAVRFLSAMQTHEGGLRANTKIPVADLLSTFTGLVALADLDALSTIDTTRALQFAKSLEQPEGGFRGGTWDDTADAEYTFYGLGTLALLN
ncbi:MAG TPA: prenyltransferase/squalene oxidase repeat-containing protein [Thermoguttaceae bacterium]|nr:prenyltransferase/squalene oxidase repeat-containing protein [Thermoguttaceae bacterium]